MSNSAVAKPSICQNCGGSLAGNYCSNCGQANKESRRPFIALIRGMFFVVFELDGRAYKTIWYLFTRPGFLSREYVSGRRASYTSPLRLFLVISIGFFLLASLNTSFQSLTSTAAEAVAAESSGVDLSSSNGEVVILTAEDSEQEDEGDIEDLQDIINFASGISFPFLSPEGNRILSEILIIQVETNYKEVANDPGNFLISALEYITLFMLMMMPLLALIQQILYITRRRYYVEQFILTLHNHSFLVFSIFLIWVVGMVEEMEIVLLSSAFGWIGAALGLWVPIYLYLSLKNFFDEGYFVTALKFFTISLVYSVCVGVGIAIFFLLLFIFS
ncbi:MAG: DUF3667 domain-containing protein [Gammaproteobacteria bacterium]|nr:DUF3667 domain-containing protein [Gammaproteobacteria bacterium]